jgi:hypothetical protein
VKGSCSAYTSSLAGGSLHRVDVDEVEELGDKDDSRSMASTLVIGVREIDIVELVAVKHRRAKVEELRLTL